MAEWKTLPKITSTTKVVFTGPVVMVNGRSLSRGLIEAKAADPAAYLRQLEQAAERTKGDQAEAEAVAQRSGDTPEEVQSDVDVLEGAGFSVESAEDNLLDVLRANGIDVENQELRALVDQMGNEIAREYLPVIIPQFQQKFPAAPATIYSQAYELSGFDEPYRPDPLDAYGPGATAVREGGVEPAPASTLPPFETQDTTGWLQFKNGVLVDPSGSQGNMVFYDPSTVVPGSPRWFREVVMNWSEKKIVEWKKRLHEFGYLSKDDAKEPYNDITFRNALAAYHEQRYLNGGKPAMGDASIAKGSRAERAKLVNVREEMGSQIRNSVRSVYRNVYGTDPTDGEVEAFSSTIFETAMELQRRFRNRYDDPNTSAAVQEATEREIERIETSPSATFLRESEEENTRLRDSLERAVAATRGLA